MLDIIIIGGGIGGLSTAIALQKKGLNLRIFESGPELRTAGAGIWVPPNAMTVLDRLGLAQEIETAGVPLQNLQIRNQKGTLLQEIDFRVSRKRFGFEPVAIHRSRLHAILSKHAMPSIFGKTCRELCERENHVVVKFEDGSEERAKLVIGADGLRSVVRGVVDQNATLRYSGQTSYRATVLVEGPIGFERTAWEVWGRGCRLGFSRVHIGEMYYYITIDAPAAEKDEGGTALLKLQRLFAGFPAPIPQLVAAMEERALLKTDIYDLSPLSHWHRGRVVLLGDAAHATTPNLGQGGAQAIEDAWVLADQLARTKEHTTAFSSYQKIRQPKANKITDVSWNLGKLAHLKNPTACHLRDFALRLMPKALVQRQAESQYPLNY